MDTKLNNLKWITPIVITIILLMMAAIFLNRDNSQSQNTSLQKVRVQAGWLLNGEFAQVCSAINRGYYAEEGLDVELIPGGPTGASFVVATTALAQDNTIDIAIDGDIIPLLRGKGMNDASKRLKLKAFATFWTENPYGFFVRKDSGVKSIEDFVKIKENGTKVRLGLTADAVIQDAIATNLDIDVSELNIVRVGFDATPMITGEVDILGGYWTTQAYELDKANIDYDFINAGEIPGFNQPSMIAIASEKTIEERPEMLEKWMRATVKGAKGVIENPELAAKEIRYDNCGGALFNEEQELWMINKSLPLLRQDQIGQINRKQIEDFSQAYFDINQIERKPTYSELVDTRILDKIY